MQTVRKFFAQFDLFAVPPTLRAKQQPEASSLLSGIISFLLACFFTYVFIINVVGIVTYIKIDSIQTQSRLGFEEIQAQSIFFAVRAGYIQLQLSLKYFEIGYNVVYSDGRNVSFPLQQCTPQQWAKLGDDYQSQYSKFNLKQFFCPKPGDIISLKKVYYAPESQYATIYIRPCHTNTSSSCQTPISRMQYVQQLKSIEGVIFISVYFLDQAINPNAKQAISYFLNTDSQFSFTTKRGVISTIQFGNYQVETDMSALPVQDLRVQKGNFLYSFRQTSIQIDGVNDNYALIYISLNRKHILVQRKVGKIDQMLSYAGGLFSIITGFLAVFIVSFNKYRYELMVAEGVFHQDEQGNAIKEKDFTFFKYVKYVTFDWIQTLFCVSPKWHDCLLIDSTRDQANKQMDVTRLFRKIQSLQYAVSHLMTQGQRQSLALLKPQSLGRIKRNRLILQYYNNIIQNKSSLNLQQYRISTQIYKFGMMLLKNQDRTIANNNQVSNNFIAQQSITIEQIQINYQNLHDINYLIGIIQKNFKMIAKQADDVQLEDEYKEIQIQLAQSFFQLESDKKLQLLQKIPIKILYRLAKKYLEFKRRFQQDFQPKKRKRVALNIIQPFNQTEMSQLNNN